jgi:hypothetical protein
VNGIIVPTTLNTGQSLTVRYDLYSAQHRPVHGSLVLTANGSVPRLSVPLSGTGTAAGQLSLTPTSTSFGGVSVGAAQNQAGSLTANGAGV